MAGQSAMRKWFLGVSPGACFGGEAGALMTIAREKTNWAAHLYVYLAILALGVTTIYLALSGTEQPDGTETPESQASAGEAKAPSREA